MLGIQHMYISLAYISSVANFKPRGIRNHPRINVYAGAYEPPKRRQGASDYATDVIGELLNVRFHIIMERAAHMLLVYVCLA